MSKKRMIAFMAVSVVFYMAASFAHPVTPTLFKSLGLGDYMFGYALSGHDGGQLFVFSLLGQA